MNKYLSLTAVAFLFLGLFALAGGFYVVPETEQVILTQFGQPVGKPVTDAGLHVKVPFIQKVNRFEKRVLEWDGPSTEMPTKDKLYIIVDAFGRWKIADPLQYFLRFRDERSALSRLDDILGSEIRNTLARHELVEAIRTSKSRKPAIDEALASSGALSSSLPQIQYGRVALEDEVAKNAKDKLKELGIELLDVRFKRINYNPGVALKINERMMSERRQIAELYRSEGAGEAAKILGNKEEELKRIESEAYREVQVLQGKADAEATAVYARAYNQSPAAVEFFNFQRSLDLYRSSFQQGTTAVLTTDSDLLKLLKGSGSGVAKTPTPPTAPTPAPPPAAPAPQPATPAVQ
jgi:membrane protease subunit HflC